MQRFIHSVFSARAWRRDVSIDSLSQVNDTPNQSEDEAGAAVSVAEMSHRSTHSDSDSVVAQAAKAIQHAHGEHKRPAAAHSDRRIHTNQSSDAGYMSEDSMTAAEAELYEPYINDKIRFQDYINQYFQPLSDVDLYRAASMHAIHNNQYNDTVTQLYNAAGQLMLSHVECHTFDYKLIEQQHTASNYIQLMLPTPPSPAAVQSPVLDTQHVDHSFDIPLRPTAATDLTLPHTVHPLHTVQRAQLGLPNAVTTNDSDELTDYTVKPRAKLHTTALINHRRCSAAVMQYEPMIKYNQPKIRPAQAAPLHYNDRTIDAAVEEAEEQHDEILYELLNAQQQLSALTTAHDHMRDNILTHLSPRHTAVYAQRFAACLQHLHQLYFAAISFSAICRQYQRGFTDIAVPDAYKQQLSAHALLQLHSNTSTQPVPPILPADTERADDDLQVCDVCHCGDGTNDNPICFCERCNIAVHQRCYGLDSMPDVEIDWYCNRCTYTLLQYNDSFTAAGKMAAKFATMQPHALAQSAIQVKHDAGTQCVLCPVAGGALKPTNTGGWCHLMCALWTPKCIVDNYKTMEPIKSVDDAIEHSRQYNAVCYICNKSTGAVIQCSTGKCHRVMHAQCAWFAGLYMSTLSNESELLLQCYCTAHTPKHTLHALAAQYSELSHKQLVQLRELQQSTLRLKGRTDLFVPKVRNMKKNKTQSQRAASTAKPASEDKLEQGRCAVCFYNNAEVQQAMRDLAMWKIDDTMQQLDHRSHTHNNLHQPATPLSDRPIRLSGEPVVPYPHQRTASLQQPQELLQCNRCGVEVHPVCYGVSVLTAQAVYEKRRQGQGEAVNGVMDTDTYWTCTRCSAQHTQQAACVICQRQGGALKPVADAINKWCHVLCALWIVGVEFGDVDKLEPITGTNAISKQQRKLKCTLCKKVGPCIMCRSCDATFHPLCNYLNGSYMGVYHTVPGSFEALYIAACLKHSTLLLSRPATPIDCDYADAICKRTTTQLALQVADRVYQRDQIKEQLHDVEAGILQTQRTTAHHQRYEQEKCGAADTVHGSKIRLKLTRKSSGYGSDASGRSSGAQDGKQVDDAPSTLRRRTSLPRTAGSTTECSAVSAVNQHNHADTAHTTDSANGDTHTPAHTIKKRKLSNAASSEDAAPSVALNSGYTYDECVYVQYGVSMYRGKVVDISSLANLIAAYRIKLPKLYAEHSQEGFTRLIHGIEGVAQKRYATTNCYLVHHAGWSNNDDTYYVESCLYKDTEEVRAMFDRSKQNVKQKK